MRSFNIKILCSIGLLAGMAIIAGCGSGGDLLDEVGQRYQANIEIADFGGSETLSIDVAQDDCDGNVTTNTDWEDFGPVLANVEIQVASNAAGLSLQNYTIEYIPLPSADGSGTIVNPPVLADPLPGFYNLDIPSGGSASFAITCMSVDTKEEYRDAVGFLWFNDGTYRYWIAPALDEGLYRIRITFNFIDTEGQTQTIPLDRTVWLGDFDNC